MNNTLMRFQQAFLPLEPEILADGPELFIDSALWLTQLEPTSSHVIYIGNVSQLPADTVGITCALIQDVPLSPEAAAGNNIFLFPKSTDPEIIFSKLLEYFTGRTIHTRKTDAIFEAYLRRDGLQAILDISAESLGAGLALCTPDHQLAASSAGLRGRLGPYKDIGDIFSRLPPDVPIVDPYLTAGDCQLQSTVEVSGSQRFAVIGIQRSGVLQTYLMIELRGSGFKYWDRELIKTIIQVLANEWGELNSGVRSYGYSFEKFIVHLLDGSIQDSAAIDDSARLFRIDAGGCFALFLVSISQYQRLLQSVQSIRTDLVRLLGGGYSSIYKDYIAIIYPYRSQDAFSRHDTAPFAEYLERVRLYGTCSRAFFHLSEAHGHFIRTRRILDLYFCAPEGQYFNLEADMGVFPMIDALMKMDYRDSLVDPVIQQLLEVDKTRRTSYVDTLYAYLKHSKNPAETWKALFIHRNTLDYRLQRISELTGLDWNDGDLLCRLYLSISAVKYEEYARKK